jgi:hypothetical protein
MFLIMKFARPGRKNVREKSSRFEPASEGFDAQKWLSRLGESGEKATRQDQLPVTDPRFFADHHALDFSRDTSFDLIMTRTIS